MGGQTNRSTDAKRTTIPSPMEVLLNKWEEDIENPLDAQRETLRAILGRLKSLQTLKERGLDENSTLEDFIARHPVTEYAYYEDAILAVAEGRTAAASIVGCDPKEELLGFKTTSGTTRGKGKLLPRTAFDRGTRMQQMMLVRAMIDRAGIVSTGKTVSPFKMGVTVKTPSGLIAGGASTLALMDPYHRANIQKSRISPLEIYDLEGSSNVSMYAHLIAALINRDEVGSFACNYANQIVQMFLLLKENWQQVAQHLRSGISLADGLVDGHSLPILHDLIGPGNIHLAETVSKECQAGFENIIPRLFPNCTHICAVGTGTMKPYALMLSSLAGPIPVLSLMYTSSEAGFGINTDPLADVSLYTLMPRGAIFEFIPINEHDAETQQPQTLTIDQLEIDTPYEILVTTEIGLFRYRMGDVVQVKKFEKKTPVIEFLYRKSVSLSLENDRMTERHFTNAMAQAQKHCNVYIPEYTFDIDLGQVPARYVAYCAASHDTSPDTLQLLSCELDLALAYENSYYKSRRDDDLIGAIQIAVVDSQGFEKYASLMVADGTDPGQYKIPRCIVNERLRDCMKSAARKE